MRLARGTPRDALLAACLALLLGLGRSHRAVRDNRAICLLPPEEGPCNILEPRWYYYPYTQTCQEFSYGGCQGNANNFHTKEECEHCCNMMIKNIKAICLLPAEEGPCNILVPRWYYNPYAETCQEFSYGQCQGNANNFRTKEECMQTCNVMIKRRAAAEKIEDQLHLYDP